jgi:hypothetical protein
MGEKIRGKNGYNTLKKKEVRGKMIGKQGLNLCNIMKKKACLTKGAEE